MEMKSRKQTRKELTLRFEYGHPTSDAILLKSQLCLGEANA